MRDRLIELLCNVKCEEEKCYGNCLYRVGQKCDKVTRLELCTLFAITDHLLAAGVIVPPCKVGDRVYMPWQWCGKDGIAILTVERISITGARTTVRTDFYSESYAYFNKYKCGVFGFDDFGKTIFLTREEAERALAERS